MKNSVKLLLCLGAVSALYGCGSSPNNINVNTTQDTPVVEAEEVTMGSNLDIIEADFMRTFDVDARNLALVELANTFVEENKCAQSDIILASVESSLSNPYTHALSSLLKLECQLPKHTQFQNNSPMLQLLEQWSTDTLIIKQQTSPIYTPEMETRASLARASLLAKQTQYAAALETLLSSSSQQQWLSKPEYNNTVWQWFSLISNTERTRLANIYPALKDYYALLQLIEDEALNDEIRQANIQQWLTQYPNSTVAQALPKQIAEYLSLGDSSHKNTVVLLPLSGRLVSQGEAIKQGILAAYLNNAKQLNNQNNPSITFLDTGSQNSLSENITSELLSEFDIVIGPLLKSHIEQIAQITVPAQKRVLLNQADISDNQGEVLRAFYSLSPEQEAEQLAMLMQSEGIHKPILIDDNSNIAKRMSDAFSDAWIQANQVSGKVAKSEQSQGVQKISYTDNKSMRIGITAALDVLQSQRRIQQLSNLSSERVYSVTRNRRDLDAFVVFAKPDDLELINPIIEASISLFTDKQIPVFASSYSYDHKQNKNTQRDLRNLVFIDMPWLLPNGRSASLSKQVDQLFNQPPSAFLRLFAFGYDAFSISENIAQLSTFQHMNIKGLTGKLSVDSDKSLVRQLDSLAITDNANGS